MPRPEVNEAQVVCREFGDVADEEVCVIDVSVIDRVSEASSKMSPINCVVIVSQLVR